MGHVSKFAEVGVDVDFAAFGGITKGFGDEVVRKAKVAGIVVHFRPPVHIFRRKVTWNK